jgi:hypothetical protein
MKPASILITAAIAVCGIALMTYGASQADDGAAPVFGVKIPQG